MRLAAIYLEEHEYLFDQPQTINFGGKYFYEFENHANGLIIRRKLNKLFIDGLFDLTNLSSKITSINAIVGQNGSGKSTLLDLIRSEFISHSYALPESHSVFIVEYPNYPDPVIIRNDFNIVFLEKIIKGKKVLVKVADRIARRQKNPHDLQTIYYSPHYDYKFNPNFDDVDNHDISFDKILEQDLDKFDEKIPQESGYRFSAGQELLFKNSMRQIEFLSSSLVENQKIFKNIFELQNHYEPIIFFREYKNTEKEWNTPMQFRSILKLISNKTESELRNWHKIRKFKNKEVHNQLEVNKYRLKRIVIKSIMTILYRQMERRNTYLEEGDFSEDYNMNELDKLEAYDLLLFFIENSSLTLGSNKSKKIININSFKLLISTIYASIDEAENEDSVSQNSLKTSKENAIKILQLQQVLLKELSQYYYLFRTEAEEVIISETDRIEGFISYMPFSRRLSSGENALLNLFSRIYYFLITNLKEIRFRRLKPHYILLLDEADLGFHPSWKKKYVNALLKTIPYFFNELENNPTIQIIFTTHDPLTLSDLPNSNVVYLERKSYEEKPNILGFNDSNRPSKTFAANISDLLADSFFVEKSLIGEFAYDLIQKTINWLSNKLNYENADYYKKIIAIIDEPIIKRKLAEMYDDKMNTQFQLSIVEKQIEELLQLRNKLEK